MKEERSQGQEPHTELSNPLRRESPESSSGANVLTPAIALPPGNGHGFQQLPLTSYQGKQVTPASSKDTFSKPQATLITEIVEDLALANYTLHQNMLLGGNPSISFTAEEQDAYIQSRLKSSDTLVKQDRHIEDLANIRLGIKSTGSSSITSSLAVTRKEPWLKDYPLITEDNVSFHHLVQDLYVEEFKKGWGEVLWGEYKFARLMDEAEWNEQLSSLRADMKRNDANAGEIAFILSKSMNLLSKFKDYRNTFSMRFLLRVAQLLILHVYPKEGCNTSDYKKHIDYSGLSVVFETLYQKFTKNSTLIEKLSTAGVLKEFKKDIIDYIFNKGLFKVEADKLKVLSKPQSIVKLMESWKQELGKMNENIGMSVPTFLLVMTKRGYAKDQVLWSYDSFIDVLKKEHKPFNDFLKQLNNGTLATGVRNYFNECHTIQYILEDLEKRKELVFKTKIDGDKTVRDELRENGEISYGSFVCLFDSITQLFVKGPEYFTEQVKEVFNDNIMPKIEAKSDISECEDKLKDDIYQKLVSSRKLEKLSIMQAVPFYNALFIQAETLPALTFIHPAIFEYERTVGSKGLSICLPLVRILEVWPLINLLVQQLETLIGNHENWGKILMLVFQTNSHATAIDQALDIATRLETSLNQFDTRYNNFLKFCNDHSDESYLNFANNPGMKEFRRLVSSLLHLVRKMKAYAIAVQSEIMFFSTHYYDESRKAVDNFVDGYRMQLMGRMTLELMRRKPDETSDQFSQKIKRALESSLPHYIRLGEQFRTLTRPLLKGGTAGDDKRAQLRDELAGKVQVLLEQVKQDEIYTKEALEEALKSVISEPRSGTHKYLTYPQISEADRMKQMELAANDLIKNCAISEKEIISVLIAYNQFKVSSAKGKSKEGGSGQTFSNYQKYKNLIDDYEKFLVNFNLQDKLEDAVNFIKLVAKQYKTIDTIFAEVFTEEQRRLIPEGEGTRRLNILKQYKNKMHLNIDDVFNRQELSIEQMQVLYIYYEHPELIDTVKLEDLQLYSDYKDYIKDFLRQVKVSFIEGFDEWDVAEIIYDQKSVVERAEQLVGYLQYPKTRNNPGQENNPGYKKWYAQKIIEQFDLFFNVQKYKDAKEKFKEILKGKEKIKALPPQIKILANQKEMVGQIRSLLTFPAEPKRLSGKYNFIIPDWMVLVARIYKKNALDIVKCIYGRDEKDAKLQIKNILGLKGANADTIASSIYSSYMESEIQVSHIYCYTTGKNPREWLNLPVLALDRLQQNNESSREVTDEELKQIDDDKEVAAQLSKIVFEEKEGLLITLGKIYSVSEQHLYSLKRTVFINQTTEQAKISALKMIMLPETLGFNQDDLSYQKAIARLSESISKNVFSEAISLGQQRLSGESQSTGSSLTRGGSSSNSDARSMFGDGKSTSSSKPKKRF